MITGMSSELIEINPNELRALLIARGLSRYDLAQKLDISTKTVQRWLNESVRRIRLDTLNKLALALDVSPEQLKKSSTTISNRTTNKALEEICSREFVKRIRTTGDWLNFLNILKSFSPESLCSEQRLALFKYIGICSFYLKKFRACRLYLNQAYDTADALDMPCEKLEIINWHAMREQGLGNFLEARNQFDKAESFLKLTKDPSVHAIFYLKKARLLHQIEQYEESIACNKYALILEYKQKNKPNMLHISFKYLQLGVTYLRLRNYTKARTMFLRTLRASEKAGWVRGICFGHFYLGVIYKLSEKNSSQASKHFGKARILHHFSGSHNHDTAAGQIEFLYFLNNHKFEESKSYIIQKFKKSRNSRLHFSYAVLDALFLQKLRPDLLSIRISYIETAREFFTKNKITQSLNILERLGNKVPMTVQEVFEIYPF